MLGSPIKAIKELKIQPIPHDKGLEVVKATQIGKRCSALAVLGADGTVYTNRFRTPSGFYGFGWDLGDFLMACARLGVITRKEAGTHIRAAAAWRMKDRKQDDIKGFKNRAQALGIKLTAQQRKKLEQHSK